MRSFPITRETGLEAGYREPLWSEPLACSFSARWLVYCKFYVHQVTHTSGLFDLLDGVVVDLSPLRLILRQVGLGGVLALGGFVHGVRNESE